MKHYKYGSSTAERTIKCPGWAIEAAKYPSLPPGSAAIRGTALHKVFEYGAKASPGMTVEGYVLTEDDVTLVEDATNALTSLVSKYDVNVLNAEHRVEYSKDVGGTLDVVGYSTAENLILVADLKTGGQGVYARRNPQLLFGAAFAYRSFPHNDRTRFVLAIIQPERLDDKPDVWETDLATVEAFRESFLMAVHFAERGGLALNAGPWCKYCPARTFDCPGVIAKASQALRLDPKREDTLAEALALADALEGWSKEVRGAAQQYLEHGNPVIGWKLVPKRARRMWVNDDDAEASLNLLPESERYVKKLISPAQAEKACKRLGLDFEELENVIVSVSNGTTLVREDDPRPAVGVTNQQIANTIAAIENQRKK